MAVRSEQSRRAILESTMKLLDERQAGALSVQKLSIERIAREAGVSKTTIYRWWPSKTALVIDTFLDNHIARTPVRADVPAIDALREHLASLAEVYSGYEGHLMAQLVAECQYDPQAMAEFRLRFWNHRQDAVALLIGRAVQSGEIRGDIAPEVIADLLYAPIYFRLLLQSGPLDRESMHQILDAALVGIHPDPGVGNAGVGSQASATSTVANEADAAASVKRASSGATVVR